MAETTPRELDAYRERVDRFIADLDQEYYDHFAGLKDDFDLESIYRDYEDVTSLDQARRMQAAMDGSFSSIELARFACEGYLGALTRRHEEQAAMLEAKLKTTVDGEEIPFRMLRPAIANSAERDRRARLERIRNELTEEHLNPLLLASHRETHEATRELGADTLPRAVRQVRLQARRPGRAVPRLPRLDGVALRRRGGQGAARERRDRPRRGRALGRRARLPRHEWDPVFPADRMLPALVATLQDLGIDLHAQENIHLDVEERPHKTPRAFCAPIEVPGKVMLVIQPIGGPDDWRALFHEAGHAEHFANTRPELTVEERRLGDSAVTEGWAMLMQYLTSDPVWLARRLDFPRPAEFASEGAAHLLFFVRRYCAKLLYELEFHVADDLTRDAARYVELLGEALKIEPSPVDYLADIDASFYVSSYLRSWAFEAQLRSHLREEFGNAWFARREAGSLLRELWGEGQRWPAEDFLRDITGSTLELESVAERVREHLALV